MLVIRKEKENDELENNKTLRSQNHAYNVVLHILQNYSDLSIEDQYIIFSRMTFFSETKESFRSIRDVILKDYNHNINQDSVSITEFKAGYHLSNGMLEKHFDSIEQIDDQLEYYEQLFIKEKKQLKPDIDRLAKISLVMERLINRRSVLNVGTPIILFLRYQVKKQKLEVQRIKEQYRQKELNKIIIARESANDSQKLDIKDKNTVTTNIDELERRAKLKNFGDKQSRGNTNRQDHKSSDEELRVQSDANDNNKTDTRGQDPSSEDTGSGDERRTKEAKF